VKNSISHPNPEQLASSKPQALTALVKRFCREFEAQTVLEFSDFKINYIPASDPDHTVMIEITIYHQNGTQSVHSIVCSAVRGGHATLLATSSRVVTTDGACNDLPQFALERDHLEKIMLAIADDREDVCENEHLKDAVAEDLMRIFHVRSNRVRYYDLVARVRNYTGRLIELLNGNSDNNQDFLDTDIVAGTDMRTLAEGVKRLRVEANRRGVALEAATGEIRLYRKLVWALIISSLGLQATALHLMAKGYQSMESMESQLNDARSDLADMHSRENDLLSSAGLADRYLDRMQIPDDMTDSGVLFYVSAPHYGLTAADSLVSNYDISRSFLDSKFLGVNVSEGVSYPDRKKPIRTFDFTVIGDVSGETLPESATADGTDVRWSDALNLLMDSPPENDNEIKKFIAWWYENTFTYTDRSSIKLDTNHIEIERNKDGKVTNVYYDGDGADKRIVLRKQKPLKDIPQGSLQPRVDTEETAAALTSKPNGNSKRRLFLRTGVCQNLRIPEHLLKPVAQLKTHLNFTFQGAPFTTSVPGQYLVNDIRRYFQTRDAGPKISYKKYGGNLEERHGLAHLIDPQDPLAKSIVDYINKGVTDPQQRISRIHDFWAENTSWSRETGDVSARPPLSVTMIRSANNNGNGGDCDVLTIGEATLLAADGSADVALIYADTDPSKVNGKEVYSSHVLLGIDPADIDKIYDKSDANVWHTGDGRSWVLTEPQGGDYYACANGKMCQHGSTFGEFSLGTQLTVRYIEPITSQQPNHP